AKTPQHVVDRLANEVKTAVADSGFKSRLGEQGLDVFGSSSAEMLAGVTAGTKKRGEGSAAAGAQGPQTFPGGPPPRSQWAAFTPGAAAWLRALPDGGCTSG